METNKHRPLSPGRTYHFNIIYNYARCPLSTTEDTQLSLAWTQRAADILGRHGMDSGYYHDRDCPKGQSIVTELTQVIKASELTFVLLSPGFVRDCWPRYWLLSSFRSLFESSAPSSSQGASTAATFSSSRSGSSSYSLAASLRSSAALSSQSAVSTSSDVGGSGRSEVILVSLGLGKEDLPVVLKNKDVLYFPRNWQHDDNAWSGMEGALGLKTSTVEYFEERSEGDITQSSEASLHSSFSMEDSPGPARHHSLLSHSSQDPPDGKPQRHQKATLSEDFTVSVDHHHETSDIRNGKMRRKQPGFLGTQRQTGCGAEDKYDGVEERQPVKENKTPRTEEAGVSEEVESAVLQRLCNTGLRRESVEESTITRVFVHGNTVAIDTLRTNGSSTQHKKPSPRAAQDMLHRDRTPSSEGYVKDRDSLATSATDSNPGFTFTHRTHVDTNTGGSRPSALSSDQTLSTLSPRRKLQYSEEYGNSSDPAYSISLTTEDCERLSSSQRSDTLDGMSQTQMASRTQKPVEESFRTSTPSVTDQESTVYTTHQQTVTSAYASRTKSPFAGSDNVDSNANSMASNKFRTAAACSGEQDRVSQTARPQLSAQTVYAENVSPRRNHAHDSGYTATAKNSDSGTENQHQRPYGNNKPQLAKSQNPTQDFRGSGLKEVTTHRKEVEEPVFKQKAVETTSQSNFITSIEDEHDTVMNDLSGSWSTSEYGTITPPHDMSSASQDSGFLSSGLASFSHPSSINDSKSRKQDVYHPPVFLEDSRSSAARSSDTMTLYSKTADAKSSNPLVCNQFTKSFYNEETKSEFGFLERSSLTKTSVECDNQILQAKQFQTGDKLADPLEESLTIKHMSKTSGNMVSKQSTTTEFETRVQNLSPEQAAVGEDSRKDGVLCGTVSARASRVTKVDIHRALNRRESWIYVDVDKGWTLTHIILPLYRIVCYALSRPELPYF